MEARPSGCVFGVETEFGCLVLDEAVGEPDQVVEKIKDTVFYDMKVGVLDLHARDEVFEPAQSGGFLINGGRLYIDAVGSHLEYATAECRSIKDLIASDRAGQRIINQAIRELGLQDSVSVYNNSVDHFGGHTFGCHENYLVRMEEDYFSTRVTDLITFLVTRQIFAGVGRVGGHILSSNGRKPSFEEMAANPIDYVWVSQVYGVDPDPEVEFQLSQRADHILKGVASRVRFNRAIINPKWEHFYSHDQMQRLHLLFGESNQSEYAYALKIGTTRLVLRLIDLDAVPTWTRLAHPLLALRQISRDRDYRWRVVLADGGTSDAVSIQRAFLEATERFRGEDSETDWVLDEWARTLDGLASDPLALGDRLDWVAKFHIVNAYREEMGSDWSDDALHSVDLEYHNIDPESSLFHALDMKRYVGDLDILDAMTDAPQDTRAHGRSVLIRKILKRRSSKFYVVDWNAVAMDRYRIIDLDDPLEPYAGLADEEA